jgi:uncharacterized protein (TIGR03067 family)
MKKLLPLLTVLLVLPLLGSDSPRGDDGAAVQLDEQLQGTWVHVSLERNGHLMMQPKSDITFRGQQCLEKCHGEPRAGSYTTNTGRNPRRLEIIHGDNLLEERREYIYEVRGDILKLVYSGPGGERPTSFDNLNTKAGYYVATYRRAKSGQTPD